MRILALDAALSCCSAALVQDGVLVAGLVSEPGRGAQGRLAEMVERLLRVHPGFDAVAVTVGPGSFTGLRTALSLAHGLAGGLVPVVGVSVAEALGEAAGDLGGRVLWTAIDSRRGRVFLDIAGVLAPFALDDLPRPLGPVAVAGDAADAVAERLSAWGFDVVVTGVLLPEAASVAAVGARRLAGLLAPLAAQPLYVDAPEAKLPAGGLRPHPLA